MPLIETRRIALLSGLGFALAITPDAAANAGDTTFCVTCTEPAQTYTCTVKTPEAYPGARALRLYCMVRTAKDGNHKTCGAKLSAASACSGAPKTYTYKGPAIPSALQSKAEKFLKKSQTGADAAGDSDDDKPDTVVKMTTRAVKSSREGLSTAGSGVRDATRGTTKRVGSAVRGAGAGVGNAAKTTYNCITSLFRDCWSSDEAEPEQHGPQPEAKSEAQ
jgi:hypothetical protein